MVVSRMTECANGALVLGTRLLVLATVQPMVQRRIVGRHRLPLGLPNEDLDEERRLR